MDIKLKLRERYLNAWKMKKRHARDDINLTASTERNLVNTLIGITVYGYIRRDFDEQCIVEEIIKLIICFYQSSSGSLYVFGSGQFGNLGLEEYFNQICPKPTLCRPFDGNQNYAMHIAVSEKHSLILDIFGSVWACGHGYLGNGKFGLIKVPQKLKLSCQIIDISVGDSHSLLFCDNGSVQSFGMDDCGQTGHSIGAYLLVPKTIKKLEKYKIVQLCAGGDYSAVLTEDGDLFCFGYNRYGQCGVGRDKGWKIMVPTKVKLNDEIAFIACGTCHSLLITRRRLVYAFGSGHDYKLGNGSQEHKYTPNLIQWLKKIKTCAAGWMHSLCVDEEGIIWSFGSNEKGQCGLASSILQQSTPRLADWFVSNNIKAKNCAAGYDQSSIITADGSLYVFGQNNTDSVPSKVDLPQNMAIEKVSLGKDHISIIC